MKKRRLFAALGAIGSLLVAATVGQAQIELGSAGGVTVWSTPVENPPAGTVATNISLTSDEGTKLVTFENVAIRGQVQQVWDALTMSAATQGTAKGAPAAGPLYSADWVPSDSHLVVTMAMVGGQAGGGYTGIFDENDGSLGDGGLTPTAASAALVGIGDISMLAPTDAFFLDTQFQTNSVDWAYIVAPATAAADGHVTMTLGVLGEGIVNSGDPGGAFFEDLPIRFAETLPGDVFCDTSTADVCFDFRNDPVDDGAQVIAQFDPAIGPGTEWRATGGIESGYLSITDAANGQRGTVILPDLGGGGQFVLGGRTGGANGAHHVDNLEATLDEANNRLNISAQLRVGGGTDQPADGFSFNFVRPGDPLLAGDGNGYAGINTEDNLPEEGSHTGISIGFDEWQSGPEAANDSELAGASFGSQSPEVASGEGARDAIGMSLRVDGILLGQARLTTFNGAVDDPTSLQTGPRGPGGPGDISELGWAQLTIEAPASGAVTLSDVTVTWKGQEVEFVPEPASGLMGLLSLLGLAMLRRRNG